MADDRIRDVAHAVSTKPRAIGQVDILVGREEILVEPAQFVEHGFRHQAGRAAHAEYLQRLRRVHGGHSVQPLERAAGPEEPVAGAVDNLRVVHIDDARRHQRKSAGLIETADQCLQPSRIGNRVVVQKRHDRRARVGNAGVVSAGESAVVRQGHDADAAPFEPADDLQELADAVFQENRELPDRGKRPAAHGGKPGPRPFTRAHKWRSAWWETTQNPATRLLL